MYGLKIKIINGITPDGGTHETFYQFDPQLSFIDIGNFQFWLVNKLIRLIWQNAK